MYLLKNIPEHVLKLLSTKTYTESVRNEEKRHKRLKNTWALTVSQAGKEKSILPSAPSSLQKYEIDNCQQTCNDNQWVLIGILVSYLENLQS